MNLRRTITVLSGAALSVVMLVTPVGAQPAQTVGASTTYQINARHDGSLVDTAVGAPPLSRKWSRDLGGNISYPIVAGGRVFVTATSPDERGTVLHAIDAATGENAWGPVDLGDSSWWSALAYGGGRLYAQKYDGVLTAFNPVTGAKIWTVALPGQYSFTSPPTFAGGVVYTGGAGSGGTLYAVNAADGTVLWTQPVANGDSSSPAVTANGVYVSYACEQTYAFDPKSGNPVWHHETDCSGGGGRTPVLADGGVWVRDDAGMTPSVLNASDGQVRGTYEVSGRPPAPAFDGRQGYFVDDGVLQERHSRTLATRWKFEGDGQISTAPIVVNGYVYVGSRTGRLWALNGATGQSVWTTDVGAPIKGPDEHNASPPLTGLGAGGGLVVVPATHLLVAYGQ
ncbi:PQQ-binding-like beta-propeller repeat protein [Streptomyces sp. NBC_00053]|uniref:outer membrane protein assembly factor BamB family protein n=1 Tax=unclassified Streptomyces TaxID=2593676 RepID=UPI000FAF1A2D|nr:MULTISPECIES: PQQ-binding-like beta-propeller repeat protein [unclassified Streptomyces]WSG50876.1 PQQ-binding-like beta-propeller repeat protein [Streptomyces sp. NBC_01732]WSX01521.1 PQQ-binding-like beta-propeller repeat protein [Streptomyces sp. NBC_00987]MCX4396589.1 PQQ-binding-like beta-propeller repeat protein [Streptomyces sp. NBC_01767]MCX5100763.1 PQQ-binding-like beta-propeller repeat protein [Streptomyces sp. NBC_00439]MCX5160284.1 PQQ-binding-like beta-propeller repeat protein